MTSAATVTPGQPMAMIPTMTPRTPNRINEVEVDLNMSGIPFCSAPRRAVLGARVKMSVALPWRRAGGRLRRPTGGHFVRRGAHRAGPVRPPAGSGREGVAAGLASDVEVVADVEDAAGHPGCADHRVVFGPGA